MSEKEEIVPTPEEFFISTPLYEKIKIDEKDDKDILAIINLTGNLDVYCPECKNQSILIRTGSASYCSTKEEIPTISSFSFQCSRDNDHRMLFIVLKKDNTIEKIGQNPSLANLHIPEIEKYSKVLDNKYYIELKKAIGLTTHGIGVGSFVYLRRIFEFLIHEEYLNNVSKPDWDEDKYKRADMSEKINILKADLPDFLVEKKAMYSILSKGIHELEEKECLSYFPIVKIGIECILDQKIEKKEKAKKEEEAKKAIDAIHQDIK